MAELTETSELQAFGHVVEGGSVAAAARELNLPRATVSRRLARLEERLGVRLLHRTTRKQGLTDAGEELFRHARAILGAIADAEGALRQRDTTPRGLLRVSMPPFQHSFGGLFPAFMKKYPEVQLEVDWSTRYVDMVAEGFDVAMRAGHSPLESGLIARRFQRMAMSAWASPAYLAARGTPANPEALADHACLRGFVKGVRPVTQWPLVDGGHVRVDGPLVSNELAVLVDAMHHGLGIALLPDAYVTHTASDVSPVRVLEGQVGAYGGLAMVYPEREFLPPAVRAFVDHVVDWFDTRPMGHAPLP